METLIVGKPIQSPDTNGMGFPYHYAHHEHPHCVLHT